MWPYIKFETYFPSCVCRLGEPEALLWKQAEAPASASEAYSSTVLAHNQADTNKSSVVECFDWNASGTILATGSMDGVIRLWDPSGTWL